MKVGNLQRIVLILQTAAISGLEFRTTIPILTKVDEIEGVPPVIDVCFKQHSNEVVFVPLVKSTWKYDVATKILAEDVPLPGMYHSCSPLGNFIADWYPGEGVKIVDIESQEVVSNIPWEQKPLWDYLQFSPDETKFVLFDSDVGVIHVFEVENGRKLLELPSSSHVLAFSPDGDRMYYREKEDSTLEAYMFSKKALVESYPVQADTLAINSEDSILAVTSRRFISIWDIKTQEQRRKWKYHPKESIDSSLHESIFLPDGRRLILRERLSLSVWDIQSGELLEKIKTGCAGIAFDSTGTKMAAANPLSTWLIDDPNGRQRGSGTSIFLFAVVVASLLFFVW
eukprot:CAMPEP_0115012684 /NCGR_PEP_ID=MMETSP0216-20121206/24900_1 /TAXON_ID=223996 /ORGANISM="Protocruzia adherens, Strain Boccale" /LENGTH=340 /DNA_ID=CAMNT_0002381821 /DNA_START=27 /DNA_END=1046 /DNA_ORIENTATION=+